MFATKTGSSGDSFLSFLNLSSNGPNDDVEPEATPAARALKHSEAVSTLLASAAPVPPASAENQTLPLKLSFNIFGTTPNVKASTTHQTEDADAPPTQQEPKPAAVDPAPLLAVSNFPPAAPQIPGSAPRTKVAPEDNADTGAAQAPKITLPTPVTPVETAASSMVPAVTPAVMSHAVAPATTANAKTERARSSNASPAPLAVAQSAAAVVPVPSDAVPGPPVNIPAAAPADAQKPPALDDSEPRPQQNQPSLHLHADVTPPAASPSQLAFALRVQPDPRPASAPAVAPALSTAQLTSSPASAVTPEPPPQANPTEKSPATQNRPASPESSATTAVQSAASRASQDAGSNSGTGAKGSDTGRDGDRGADPKAEPSLSLSPAPPAAAQSYFTAPASTAAAPHSSPVSTQATAPTAPAALTPANETPRTGTANQISITVPGADQQNVQVRLTDRAGEVRVSVHAPTEELAGTLRQDLGSLTTKLNQSGFSTEAFTPSTGGGTLSRDQKNADPQPQNQDSSRQTPGRSPQQQNPQQNGQGKRPAWMDEFEGSMAN